MSFPVCLYAATSSSARVSFHQVHKDTKRRIKLVPHDPELGPVQREDLVKGYEYEKGSYVIIEPAELDAIKIETNKTIQIEKFVPRDSIDQLYQDGFYYVAPDGAVAQESFQVFTQAMERKEVAGIARVVLSGRERIAVLEPRGPGMVMTTLRYGPEVRSEAPYFEEIVEGAPNEGMLQLAEKLIDQNQGEFDPDEYVDRYGEAVLELVKSKIEGRPADVVKEEAPSGNVVSLMEALRQSVEGGGEEPAPAAKSAAKKAKPAKRAAASAAKPKRKVAKKSSA